MLLKEHESQTMVKSFSNILCAVEKSVWGFDERCFRLGKLCITENILILREEFSLISECKFKNKASGLHSEPVQSRFCALTAEQQSVP